MNNTPITQRELETYLWEAACILRGHLDAADFKQYVFPLLFWKRLSDVFEEEYETALSESEGDHEYASFESNHRFQIPAGCHWTDLRNTSSELGVKIRDSMQAIESANESLIGIFGDARWSNKERLPDALLKQLIEHISSELLNANRIPADELGNGYEYLIKKFADDSGHTAQEFYTNRTVVDLMTEILEPSQKEKIYDPTCGTGGMLLNCILHAKKKGKEYRNIKLYGQELNLITSAIAKMNLIVHGMNEFRIERGDSLANPKFFNNDKLMTFDVVLANPPYSISNWNQDAWITDPYGRSGLGVPPQGCADYAFLEHIIASMDKDTGRAAILFPHGVLFRNDEMLIRKRIIQEDLIEGVIGIGPDLFYNSTMEACVMILRSKKRESDRNKIMFVDAHKEVMRKNALSYISDTQLERIVHSYSERKEISQFARHVDRNDIEENDFKLSIPLYLSSDRYAKYFAQSTDEDKWERMSPKISSEIDAYRQKIRKLKALIDSARGSSSNGYCLKEIVQISKATVKDPANNGIDRYVGLEHIQPNETRVHQWGNTHDGTSFNRLFEPRDVLFSKRRVYLRKAAVASFRGVCSGDILVAKANEEIVIPEYLVHLFHSDDFIRYGVRKSAGGFSPRIRWKDVAEFPVTLPPLQKQEQISSICAELDSINSRLRDNIDEFSKLSVSMQQMGNSSLVHLKWPFAEEP